MTTEKAESALHTSVNEDVLMTLFRNISKSHEKMPDHPDMVYLFGQTKENEKSVLDVTDEFPGTLFGFVGQDDTEASGFPGFSAWKQKFQNRGIPSSSIVGILGSFTPDPADGKLKGNTLTEAQALVRYAKDHGLKKIVLAASPWHLPRAFMTVVTVLLKEYPELRVYARIGTELPWFEETVHSQGKVRGRRIDMMTEEMQRISDYHAKGDLASPEEVLAYLTRRDSTSVN